jgi:pimeloyl-ACP methyl ester carboxylesterase
MSRVYRTLVLALAGSLSLLVAMAASCARANDAPAAAATGLHLEVTFDGYSPLSSSWELAQRILTPLRLVQLRREFAGKPLREQSIDLTQERFSLYVPNRAPPKGYALLVFIPPRADAIVPPHWVASLDHHGMILVSWRNSGNEEDVFTRRIPLALLATYNVMQRYPVDPQRVYVGGLSGGSRVALRAALAYPDLYHGAFLNAGSDVIGTDDDALPSPELFKQFQESSRLVYVTGDQDGYYVPVDIKSRKSLQSWCVFDLGSVEMFQKGHELADAVNFEIGLKVLEKRASMQPRKLSECRERVAREMTAQLQQARDLIDHGNAADAKMLLEKIDSRYGGLAAPTTTELAEAIGN